MLKIVFMGSPPFAATALEALVGACSVELVVTQPDKPSGRGKKLAPPAVKEVALREGLPVIQPRSARKADPETGQTLGARLAALGADVGVVVAYGKILPPEVLEAFPHGCLNVHASILPAYRGAAPIQWAIIRGETETGVSIMRLDEGMDTGPVLRTATLPIAADDTAGTLFERLAPLGARTLLEALEDLEAGRARETPQDDAAATYAPMLTKADGALDWSEPAARVACRVRGVDPWPGAQARLGELRLKLFGARAGAGTGAPGEILAVGEEGLTIACGEGAVTIGEVQAAGKRRMAALAFARGRGLGPGDRLDSIERRS